MSGSGVPGGRSESREHKAVREESTQVMNPPIKYIQYIQIHQIHCQHLISTLFTFILLTLIWIWIWTQLGSEPVQQDHPHQHGRPPSRFCKLFSFFLNLLFIFYFCWKWYLSRRLIWSLCQFDHHLVFVTNFCVKTASFQECTLNRHHWS